MPKIFISYRREDSNAFAGRLFDRLQARFGAESVFMDIDSIPMGVNFQQHLAAAVSACDVMLALIGEEWLTANRNGQRRLDDPGDFVRTEIESALNRGIPVVPILIGRASMPREQDLPGALKPIAFRNAAQIDVGLGFSNHVDRLIRHLELLVERTPSLPPVSDVVARKGDELGIAPSRMAAETSATKPAHNAASPRNIFISYSKHNKMTADAICQCLESRDLLCWVAPRDILPGSDWAGSITDAIASAKIMVVVFSHHANISPQVLREVAMAVAAGLNIVPFRIEDIPFSKGLTYYFTTCQWLDAFTPPIGEHIERLANTVAQLHRNLNVP
jgi:hypothetical protein